MVLTLEDRAYLYQVFKNDEHEVREGITTKTGKVRWWVYLQKPAIIRHLDSRYFGEWSDSYHSHRDNKGYSEVYCRLTIHDMYRENNGSNTGADEHTGKGAATDAFKRAAMSWGIGLYLQNSPQIWTAYDYKTGGSIDYKKQRERKNEALGKVFTWLNSLRSGNQQQNDASEKQPQSNYGKSSASKTTVVTDMPYKQLENRRNKVYGAVKGLFHENFGEMMDFCTSNNIDWTQESDIVIDTIRKVI